MKTLRNKRIAWRKTNKQKHLRFRRDCDPTADLISGEIRFQGLGLDVYGRIEGITLNQTADPTRFEPTRNSINISRVVFPNSAYRKFINYVERQILFNSINVRIDDNYLYATGVYILGWTRSFESTQDAIVSDLKFEAMTMEVENRGSYGNTRSY